MINNTTQFISNNQQPISKPMHQSSVPTPKRKQPGVKKYKNNKKTLQTRKPQLKTTILDNFYLEEAENVEKAKQVLMMASSHQEDDPVENENAWGSIHKNLGINNKIEGWKEDFTNQKITSLHKNKDSGHKQFRQKTITQFVNKAQQKSYLLNHNKHNSPYANITSTQNQKSLQVQKYMKSPAKSAVKANVVVINTTDSRDHRKLSTQTNYHAGIQTEYPNMANSGHIIKIKERMEKKKTSNPNNKHMMFDSRVFRQKYVPLHSFSQVQMERGVVADQNCQNVKYRTSHAETGMFRHRHTKSENCQNSITKYIALHTHKKPTKILTNEGEQNKSNNLRKLYELIHSFNYNGRDNKHSKTKLNQEYQRIYEKRFKTKHTQTRTYCIKQMVSNFINRQNLQNSSDERGCKIGEILSHNRRLSIRTVKQDQKHQSGNNSEKKLNNPMYNIQLQQMPIRVQMYQPERLNTIG